VTAAVNGDALSEDGIQESPVSPSSSREGTSGYLAGSGSSTASICSASGVDESADRILNQESRQPTRRSWVPGKRYPEEVSVTYLKTVVERFTLSRERDECSRFRSDIGPVRFFWFITSLVECLGLTISQ
jgi:hypothetical protein